MAFKMTFRMTNKIAKFIISKSVVQSCKLAFVFFKDGKWEMYKFTQNVPKSYLKTKYETKWLLICPFNRFQSNSYFI